MILLQFPLPSDTRLVRVARKAGSKASPVVAKLRASTPFSIVRNGEASLTEAKGTSGHNIPLNAAQLTVVEVTLDTLRNRKAKVARQAMIDSIREAGGILLPVNVQGRKPTVGEDLSDAFADILADDDENDDENDD